VSEQVAVIVNPISGTGGRPALARQRVAQARAALASHRVDGSVLLTEQPGHAPLLVRQVMAEGASLVVAWGGDGTINEVASELAFHDVPFAVIPSGSGNGLARELKIPFDATRAFAVALGASELIIDAGEMDGRLFFNLAGLGLDAQVAHEFAIHGMARRGFARYLEITAQQLFTFRPGEHTVVADGVSMRSRPLIIALANGRQYGNGAVIAPDARMDDGKLELVVIEERSALRALAQMPMVFAGWIARLPGVTTMSVREVSITATGPIVYHVDGEPCVGGPAISARIRPRALRVRVPSALQAREHAPHLDN
jgi:YegS/Rv2252/BmrU family lipid kinase